MEWSGVWSGVRELRATFQMISWGNLRVVTGETSEMGRKNVADNPRMSGAMLILRICHWNRGTPGVSKSCKSHYDSQQTQWATQPTPNETGCVLTVHKTHVAQ